MKNLIYSSVQKISLLLVFAYLPIILIGLTRGDAKGITGTSQSSRFSTVKTKHGIAKAWPDSADTFVWKAIPYAKPPVGPNRWKAPRPLDMSTEAIGKKDFCEPCTQYSHDTKEIIGKEDCLYLNIWRPQTDETDLPVYLWIHGGANSMGSGSENSGANLAGCSQMVVVAINYRLGPLGWFTHPALRDGKNARDDSGNFGTLDIIMALRWIRENIAAFGGNPDNVTIAGESAGARNVLALLISPEAAGLFHRAIASSGGARYTKIDTGEAVAGRVLLKLLLMDKKASDAGSAISYLKKMTKADIAKYLMSKKAGNIIRCFEPNPLGSYHFPNSFTDGTVIPSRGFHIVNSGTYNKVPIIIGCNADEVKIYLIFSDRFKDFRKSVMDNKPGNTSDRELYELASRYFSKYWKIMGVDTISKKLRTKQDNVYAYRFDWGSGGEAGSVLPKRMAILLGAAHAIEIPFFFGNDSGGLAKYTFTAENRPSRRMLSDAMMKYVASFVRTGDPNKLVNNLPKWEQWSNGRSSHSPKFIIFDADNGGLKIKMDNTVISALRLRFKMMFEDRYEELRDLIKEYYKKSY